MSDAAEALMRRSARLRWRQGAINVGLAVLSAWLLPRWDPNFILLGLFPFGLLRLVQGTELRIGLVRGGWTDIPFTPPVIGCWAAGGVHLQRLLAGEGAANGALMLSWVALGMALYAGGRWAQARYYARRPVSPMPQRPNAPAGAPSPEKPDSADEGKKA